VRCRLQNGWRRGQPSLPSDSVGVLCSFTSAFGRGMEDREAQSIFWCIRELRSDHDGGTRRAYADLRDHPFSGPQKDFLAKQAYPVTGESRSGAGMSLVERNELLAIDPFSETDLAYKTTAVQPSGLVRVQSRLLSIPQAIANRYRRIV
jgi:hypothetical protein